MRINLNDDKPTFISGLANWDDDDYRRELTTKFKPVFISMLKKRKIPFAKVAREMNDGKMEKELKHLKRAKYPLLSKEHLLIIKQWCEELPKA